MKKIQDIMAFLFIASISILTVLVIFGIWEIFDKDVIVKSFETLGLLAGVAMILMVSGRFIDNKKKETELSTFVPNPIFKGLRHVTLGVLIVSASLLALLGALTIWEVLSNKEILYKSMSSIGTLAFSSLLIVLTALEREGKDRPVGKKHISPGFIVVLLIAVYILFVMMF